MKVYLAGPMRGYAEFNFPAFYAYAKKLRNEGHEVFSPAEKDNERHGTAHGFNLREALAVDLEFICKHADAVALMPGWEKSKGATAEKSAADALGLELIYLGAL